MFSLAVLRAIFTMANFGIPSKITDKLEQVMAYPSCSFR